MIDDIWDIHCHILPGVDDGSQTMEESLETIDTAVSQGIRHFLVTPHFHPGRYMVYADTVRMTLGKLARACIESGRDVTFFPGQECYYFSGLKDLLRRGEVLTLAGSRYVLLEFDPTVPFAYMKQAFRDLQSAGYRIVLAHFERYKCLSEPGRLKELKQEGILLQLNYDMLLEKGGILHRNIWRRYVQDGTVDLLGSDCHGTHFRPIRAGEALRWLESSVDRQTINRILHRNVNRILNSVQV